jgi:hypothetical protein
MRALPLVLLALVGLRAPAAAQRHTAPTDTLLQGITERGRLLAEYDQASWHASDALMALSPAPTAEEVQGYVAHRTRDGWVVDFGRLSEDRSAFLVAYEARPTGSPGTPSVQPFRPARARGGFVAAAARAIELATRDFGARARPYNVAALPADGGEVWVYLLPAQIEDGVYPLGGDVRYRVSPDGERVLEKRILHASILEMGPPPEGVVTGTHTAIVDDIPEDSDVYFVLARRPALPEVVVTEHYLYSIARDGSIEAQRR